MAGQRPPDYLPRDVLARADLARACGERDLGAMLGIAMKWGGPGFTASHVARRCEMTISQVQDYVRRGRQALSIDIFDRVADGLHIPGYMLGISDRPWEDSIPGPVPGRESLTAATWTADGTLVSARELSEVNPVDRRSFLLLTGAALTSPAHEWLIAHPVSDVSSSAGRMVEPRLVDELNDMTGRLRRMDDQMGGSPLVDLVRAQTAYAVRLLREGRYTDSTGRRLYGAVGELLRLAGWVSYDNGDEAQAQHCWLAALRSAHTASDSALGANVLGFMSEQAWNLGRPADAGRLAATALAGYKGSSPRVSAILNMRAAVPYAMKRDAAECRRAIDSAYEAFRNTPSESGEPDWCYWMDETQLNENAGICYTTLKDYPSACHYLELSLPGEQDSYVRDGVGRLTHLATAYARQGEPEQACKIGSRAIDTLSAQVCSVRLTSGINRLRDELERYQRTPAVREFRDRVAELSAR
jgi:hypothetical protein